MGYAGRQARLGSREPNAGAPHPGCRAVLPLRAPGRGCAMPVEDAFGAPLWAGSDVPGRARFREALALLAPPRGDLPDWLWPMLAEKLERAILGYARWSEEFGRLPSRTAVRKRLVAIARMARELAGLSRDLTPWERERLTARASAPFGHDGAGTLGRKRTREPKGFPSPARELVGLLWPDPEALRHLSDLPCILAAYGELAAALAEEARKVGNTGPLLPDGWDHPKTMLAFDCALLLLDAGAGRLHVPRLAKIMLAAHRIAIGEPDDAGNAGLDKHARKAARELAPKADAEGWAPGGRRWIGWAPLGVEVEKLRHECRLYPLFHHVWSAGPGQS